MSRLLLLSAAALLAAGCYTDSSGHVRMGRRPAGPTREQVALQRLQSENAEMQDTIRSLRAELDHVGSAVGDVASRSDALSRATDARGQDAVALRNDLAALERRLAALEAKMANVPELVAKANDTGRKAIVDDLNRALADVDKRIAAAEKRNADEIRRVASQVRQGGGGGRSGGGGTRAGSGSGRYYEHVVKSGQSLSLIAKEYGVSQADIIAENGISDPSKLQVGQVLYIPAP